MSEPIKVDSEWVDNNLHGGDKGVMQGTATNTQPSLARRFVRHVVHMPAWHRYVLIAAIVLVGVGVVGHVRRFVNSSGSSQTSTVTTPHSSFGSDVTDMATDTGVSTTKQQPWYLSPRFLSIGGSVLGGFVIGWLMRLFVKTTVLIGLGIVAVSSFLSYFHIMNVDLTGMHQQANSDVSWVSDQAWRLKDIAISYLPVHAGGLFGAFLGFRRNRI